MVCYTPEHEGSLATLDPEHAFRLVQVWTDRYQALMQEPEIRYVLIFENRGEAVGVTLHHPHGQIYAFPYVPPVPLQELEAQARFRGVWWRARCLPPLAASWPSSERTAGGWWREEWASTAVVPFYARYPYEVHVLARRHVASLAN